MHLKRTYKIVIVSFLLFVFCAETFSAVFILADYYVDTNAYAMHCVNKNKPQMHCNGKCQMQKAIDNVTEKDKQSAERKNEININVLSSKSFFATVQGLFKNFSPKKYFNQKQRLPVDVAFQFFHPPQTYIV